MWFSRWTKRGLRRFFSGFLPFSPTTNFIPTFLPNHLIHFISTAPVMMWQAWSAGILAIYRPLIKGLHRISSLDPVLCRTRVDIIYFILYWMINYTLLAIIICPDYTFRNALHHGGKRAHSLAPQLRSCSYLLRSRPKEASCWKGKRCPVYNYWRNSCLHSITV